MRLTDEELRDVLTRAEEIERGSLHSGQMNAELEAVIEAAEATGLPRRAVELAIRERFALPAVPPAVGSLAFAKSAGTKFHVAEVLSTSADGARVRFLQGSEHSVTLDQIRPFSLIPGERVTVTWPWWGPWTCTVVSYDAAKQRVKVSDGWSDKTFPLAEVWIDPPRRPDLAIATRRRVYMALLGAGAGVGALLGSVITALLLG